MRASKKYLWIPIILISAFTLGHCGRKSNQSTEITIPEAGPYVPEDWNGEGDWSQNALKIEDIAP